MKTLNVNITNRVAVYSKRGGEIVCGNDDYQIKFTFDGEWAEYNSKTARFKWNGAFYDVPLSGDTAVVPRLVNTKQLEVGVYAGDVLHTSTSAVIKCVPSCLCGTQVQAPGSDEPFYPKAKEEADRAEAAAEAAEEAAAEAAAEAAQHLVPSVAAEINKLYELRGKNLIDPLAIVQGAIIADGSISTVGSWANYSTSDFIPINGETHVVSMINKTSGELYADRIITALYDADRNFISGTFLNEGSVSSRVINNTSATYLRVTVFGTRFTESVDACVQVEKGDTPTSWEGFTERYLLGKIDAENIDPAVLLKEEAEETVAPIVKNTVQDVLFVKPKNFLHGAELIEGYFSNAGTLIASESYNVFRVPSLQAGINYAVYPQSRFVANATTKTNLSAANVDGVFTFSLSEESTVEISFYPSNTERMVLYNADLYSYEEIERYDLNIIDQEKVAIPSNNSNSNILLGKKWAVCGDSFSEVVSTTTEDSYITGGIYAGYKKAYGYIIGNRNEMEIQHLSAGGKTLAYPADGSFHNSFTDVSGSAPYNYTDIAEDVDYITLYFGINDSHHESGTSGTDGEDVTGVIPLGTIDDENNTTFCGAWNVCLKWLIENRPFAHIGIIVSNGCDRDEYRTATIAVANKWGIPYIDLNGDERTPMMLRSTNPSISSVAKTARLKAQAISYGVNHHPSAKAHEYQSTFIEAWLRTL